MAISGQDTIGNPSVSFLEPVQIVARQVRDSFAPASVFLRQGFGIFRELFGKASESVRQNFGKWPANTKACRAESRTNFLAGYNLSAR